MGEKTKNRNELDILSQEEITKLIQNCEEKIDELNSLVPNILRFNIHELPDLEACIKETKKQKRRYQKALQRKERQAWYQKNGLSHNRLGFFYFLLQKILTRNSNT